MLGEALEAAVAEIAAGEKEEGFPADALAALGALGILGLTVRQTRWAEETDAIRAVAAADGAVGTLFARHLDGVERIRLFAPEPTRHQVLEAVAAGELLLAPDDRRIHGVPLPWCGEALETAVVLAETDPLPARSALRDAAVQAGQADAAGLDRIDRRTIDLWLADAARNVDADPFADFTELAQDLQTALARATRSAV